MMTIRNSVFAVFLLGMTITATAEVEMRLDTIIPIASKEVTAVSFAEDGSLLAVGLSDGTVITYDLENNYRSTASRAHKSKITCLLVDTENGRLVSAGEDKKVRFLSLLTMQPARTIEGFKGKAYSLALSPDGNLLAAAGDKKEIVLWDYPIGSLAGKLKGHKKKVLLVAFNDDGSELLSVGEDRQLINWNPRRQEQLSTTLFDIHTWPNSGLDVTAAVVSPDHSMVAIAADETVLEKGGRSIKARHNVSIYDRATMREKVTHVDLWQEIKLMSITADNAHLLVDNSTLRQTECQLLNIVEGVSEGNRELSGPISALAASFDGQWIAVAVKAKNQQSELYLWETRIIPSRGSQCTLNARLEPGRVDFSVQPIMAIMPFETSDAESNLGASARDLFEASVANSSSLRLVERKEIEKIVGEQRFQQAVKADAAVQIGKLIGAQYVILGLVAQLDNSLVLTIRVVNVETGVLEGASSGQCSDAGAGALPDLARVVASGFLPNE